MKEELLSSVNLTFTLTLMKLRLNASNYDLGFSFGVSESTISRTYVTVHEKMCHKSAISLDLHGFRIIIPVPTFVQNLIGIARLRSEI